MHIIEKILKEIEPTLKKEYGIEISNVDWELFQSPITDESNKIDEQRFVIRQQKSIEIIETILKLHGKHQIVTYFAELADIEPSIQSILPLVRDHVVHAINTFLLGVYILQKVELPATIETIHNYNFAWKLCGLTHDLGYPIEIANNIANIFINTTNGMLVKIDSHSPRLISNASPHNLNILCNKIDANELIQERINEWGLDINIDDYYSWLRNQNKVDHGVISALAQLKIIDDLYESLNPNREEIEIISKELNFNQKYFNNDIVSVSSALFLHNINLDYPGFAKKIRYDSAPLAFLLFLCDTVQEWDRYSKKKHVFSGDDFNIECEKDNVALYVPNKLENEITLALNKRLTGLKITVNDKIAVD